MKYLTNKIAISALLVGTLLVVSCKKEFEKLIVEQTDLSDKALIKVYNGAISSVRTYMYVDQIPVTGAALAYNAIYPSTGYAAAIAAGSHTIVIKDTNAASTQPPLTFTANLAAGKNYSIFTYDTVNAIKYVITEDEIVQPADTTARLRFANLIFSKTALPNVDVYSVKRQANIFTNVKLAEVTNFIPFASRITDSLYVRATGTTTNLTPVFTISPNSKRSYTVVYRGRYETTTGTVMPRGLSSITNY